MVGGTEALPQGGCVWSCSVLQAASFTCGRDQRRLVDTTSAAPIRTTLVPFLPPGDGTSPQSPEQQVERHHGDGAAAEHRPLHGVDLWRLRVLLLRGGRT